MVTMTVELRNVEGTEAAMGWAGGHTIVVDRPEGKAGGLGLGFNGAQLLALALGGCFCNDLRYVPDEMGVGQGKIAVEYVVSQLDYDTPSNSLLCHKETRQRGNLHHRQGKSAGVECKTPGAPTLFGSRGMTSGRNQ